jgi:uncharacterized protein (TIGR02466 family)
MAIVQSGDFTLAFPTVILRRKLAETTALNERLRGHILELREAGSGIVRSNVGAWHSDLSYFTSDRDGLPELRELLRRAVREYWAMEQQRNVGGDELVVRMTGWAMVYRNGDYAVPHVHPNSNFSGVYYVDAGDATSEHPKSGVLSCIDPRVGAGGLDTGGFRQSTSLDIRPETGLLVMFPAWLLHHVHPYQGERERIAISFNVSVHKADAAQQ